jgi:hypothetical protein
MFRLVRFLISLAMTAAFIWFAVTVPLGRLTLWGHLRAIFGTQEARDLAEGTREEAQKVAERVREELHRDMATPPAPTARKVRLPLEPMVDHGRTPTAHSSKHPPR